MRQTLFIGLLVLIFTPQITLAALSSDLAGQILLDVENHGEAWYVNPVDQHRYYLGRPDDAFDIMRSFGLGITNEDIAKIPTGNDDFDGDKGMRRRLSGRILLQVHQNGEAWYVSPNDLKRYYLGRPLDAYNLMRDFSLGITSPNLKTIPTGTLSVPDILQNVPFTAQTPYGDWSDWRQREGCEESSVLMAMKWIRGESLTTDEALAAITAMSDWEEEQYGFFVDTGAWDSANRLIRGYYDHSGFSVSYNISATDILNDLEKGRLVMVPINGRKINHNYYPPPGPERHMILVIGYDSATSEFIIHDPGTQYGANHRATAGELDYMLRDYASGVYEPIGSGRTAMISIWK